MQTPISSCYQANRAVFGPMAARAAGHVDFHHWGQVAKLADGRDIVYADRDYVKARLAEAATTLKRLPLPRGSFPARLRSAWPEMAEVFTGLAEPGDRPRRVAPAPRRIDAMDEALPWLLLLQDTEIRALVFARALGLGPTRLGREFGLSRETIRQRLNQAHDTIATALNRHLDQC